jgi:hypothetical protein
MSRKGRYILGFRKSVFPYYYCVEESRSTLHGLKVRKAERLTPDSNQSAAYLGYVANQSVPGVTFTSTPIRTLIYITKKSMCLASMNND